MVPQRVTIPFELAAMLAANVPMEWRDKPFSSTVWLSEPRNIALRIGPDLAMFEHVGPDIYMGHTWFASRGKTALEHGRAILDAIFADYGAKLIRGETPTDKKHAFRFAQMLGFQRTGEAVRAIGPVILSELESPVKLCHGRSRGDDSKARSGDDGTAARGFLEEGR